MFEIANRGQAIAHTNYWDSDHARQGLIFLSWNAGAGRLLVPDAQKAALREMKGAREVIVSRGPLVDQGHRDALEILFEDDSDSPYVIHIVAEMTDRPIPDREQGGGFVVTAWTRGGLKGRWPGRYRVVERLPWLQPWADH